MSHRQMMPEAGFIFSTESPTLLNSKDTKGGCGEGIHGKKNWTSYSLEIIGNGESRVGWDFFVKGKKLKMTWEPFLHFHWKSSCQICCTSQGRSQHRKSCRGLRYRWGLLWSVPQAGLRPEQGTASSEALSHPFCYVFFEPNQRLLEGTWSGEYF